MRSKLPPLRFVCVSDFWDKHQWETELHQMMFQKLGHFHHLTPFSDFHEQYLKNNQKEIMKTINQYSTKQLSCTDRKLYLYHAVVFISKAHPSHGSPDTLMPHKLQNERHYFIKFICKLHCHFSCLVCSRTEFSKTEDRQPNPNFNSYKPPSPQDFSSWTPSLTLLVLLLLY